VSAQTTERRPIPDKVKNVLLIVVSLAALALGGAAIAGAAQGNGSSGNSSSGQAGAQPSRDLPPQRSDEQLLTGDTAAKVRQAALAAVSGGTIERVETDADGNAAYEAHMRKADGSRITVYVNKSFDVVSIEPGP
jgi:uncharacterized membrane protein YkoI